MKKLTYGLSMMLISSTLAFAQTWDGGGDGTLWDDDDNWDTGIPVNDGSANIVIDTSAGGSSTVNYETTTRSFENLTITGNQNFFLSGVGGGELNWSGVLHANTTGGSQRILANTALTGTGSILVTSNLRLGEFDNVGSRDNTFSGGINVVNNRALILQYGNMGDGDNKTPLGTGAFTAGTGLDGSTGGHFVLNQAASARMTFANTFVNAATRNDQFGNNQLQIRIAGGITLENPFTTRFTGDFITSALPEDSDAHGWTTIRGLDITDGSRQFSTGTYEFSGDWSGYTPGNKITFDQAAFVINSANSVAGGGFYELNKRNAGAQSTVLALGVDGVNFNRDMSINNAAAGSNATDAVNQTYIGGRQAGTSQYSGNISLQTDGDHRVNLFSETGRTEFTGAINVAQAGQIVAINSGYSMATYTSVTDTGATNGSELSAFTPEGTVVFAGGAKNFAGGLEVTAGTLLINQTITGNVNVAAGATLGSDGGTGVITGDLALANGAYLAFSPTQSLDLTGTLSLDNSFGVASLRDTTGGAIDWSLIGNDTYTLLGTSFVFNDSNIANFGSENPFALGDGRVAYFENGSLALTVIPEPGTLVLLGIALGALALFRRRK